MSIKGTMVKVKCRVVLDYLKSAPKIKKPNEDAVDGEGACQLIIPTDQRVVDSNPVTDNDVVNAEESYGSCDVAFESVSTQSTEPEAVIETPAEEIEVFPDMTLNPHSYLIKPEILLRDSRILVTSAQGNMVKRKCRIAIDHTKPTPKIKKLDEDALDVEGARLAIILTEQRVVDSNPVTDNNVVNAEESYGSCDVDLESVTAQSTESESVIETPPEEIETFPVMPLNPQSDLIKPEILLRDSSILVTSIQGNKIRRCRLALDHLKNTPKIKKLDEDVVDGEGLCQVIIRNEQRGVNQNPVTDNDVVNAEESYRSCDVASESVQIQSTEPESVVETPAEEIEMFPDMPLNSHSDLIKPEILLRDSSILVTPNQANMVGGRCRVALDHTKPTPKIKKLDEDAVDGEGAYQVIISTEQRVVDSNPVTDNDVVNAEESYGSCDVASESVQTQSTEPESVIEIPAEEIEMFPDIPLNRHSDLIKPEILLSDSSILGTPIQGNMVGGRCRLALDHLKPTLKIKKMDEDAVDGEGACQVIIRTEQLVIDPNPVTDNDVVNAEKSYGSCDVASESVQTQSTEPESVIETPAEEIEMFPDMPLNPHWIKPEILLRQMFSKKKPLRLSSDDKSMYTFPDDDTVLNAPALQIPELMVLKGRLNETKSQLDHFPLQEWHSHTKQMNIANSIMPNVKRIANPEFSSQAWGKMFEILCNFDIIPNDIIKAADQIYEDRRSDKVAFDSIHLCEAPGAFVSALNHFLKISYPAIDWNWMATTLNPYHESNDVSRMINDDRLILMSLDKWTFLEDFTGNILSYPNLKYIVKERQYKLLEPRKEKSGKEPESVLLITADGSIDCQGNPSDQEKMVAHLHFGEIVTALMLLHKGGTFVLKIFTFLEASTICHLYFLSCVFQEVHLFKPSFSKEGNSEVYVICLKYLGKDSIRQVLHKKLVRAIGSYEDILAKGNILFPLQSIPPLFLERVKDAANFFCNYQMQIILRNISCFPCDTRVYEIMMKPAQRLAANQWSEMTAIEPLSVTDRLFKDEKMRKALHVDVREEQGCFADKIQRRNGNDLMKLTYIKADLLAYRVWKTPQTKTLFGGKFLIGNVKFEKSYQNIRSSRFCPGRLLADREQVREICKRYMKELELNGLKNMENICMGHSLKRVYKSMAKSCEVMLRDLEVRCFIKMTWDFVTKTDFEVQRNDLKNLIEGVKDLEKGHSMFLCRFPLLSRLQTGIIYCLTAVFEKVIIYADPEKNVVGIMLHHYKGLSQPENRKLFHSIDDIMSAIEEDEFDRPVLEMVPIKTLLDFFPGEFLVNYNILLITQDMLRTVSVLEGIMKPMLKMLPVEDQLTSFYTA